MRILFYLLLIWLPSLGYSQKYDYIWITGDDNNLSDTTRGGAIIDFNQSPIQTHYHYRELNMSISNSSICDTSGQLLFYTNGCDIAGGNDQVLFNGEGINPGIWHTILCDQNDDGYGSGYAGILTVPKPDSQNVFYIFHQSVKYGNIPVEYAFVDKLLYTVVRHTEEGTKSLIIEEKNIELMVDSLALGEMNSVKHGNGKDWWLIQPRRNSNQYYIFLLTNEGIVDTLIQTIGSIPPINEEGLGQTAFSSDGSVMARFFPNNPVSLYYFNRLTGCFSGVTAIDINYGSDWAFEGGCAFSPNGRFLYIAALLNIYQFDLTAVDVSATQTTVAKWDGVIDPIIITFLKCQLGPDCKIYILGGGDTRYYHIIHNPDEQGFACNVEQRGLVLPTPSGASIPYFPNYRLGPIDNPGLPCSPIVATNEPGISLRDDVRVWPNPASSQVSFAFSSSFHGKKSLRLFDMFGHLMKEVYISVNSEDFTLSVNDITPGLYFWEISCENGLSKRGRLIVH
jgi:hypothetical protein